MASKLNSFFCGEEMQVLGVMKFIVHKNKKKYT